MTKYHFNTSTMNEVDKILKVEDKNNMAQIWPVNEEKKECSHNCDCCSMGGSMGAGSDCGIKHDAQKTHRPELLPHEALMDVIKVLTDGAIEYGDFNWKKGIAFSRLYGAVLRHLLAFWRGRDVDPESGSPALAHAIAGLMMLLEMGSEWDDRFSQAEECLYPGNESIAVELVPHEYCIPGPKIDALLEIAYLPVNNGTYRMDSDLM